MVPKSSGPNFKKDKLTYLSTNFNSGLHQQQEAETLSHERMLINKSSHLSFFSLDEMFFLFGKVVASHASVFRGARICGARDEIRAPLKTPTWEGKMDFAHNFSVDFF